MAFGSAYESSLRHEGVIGLEKKVDKVAEEQRS